MTINEKVDALLKHVNWETYNREPFQQAVFDLILEYSEWLDQQGLVVGDGMTIPAIARRATEQDTRTHEELVNEFLKS